MRSEFLSLPVTSAALCLIFNRDMAQYDMAQYIMAQYDMAQYIIV